VASEAIDVCKHEIHVPIIADNESVFKVAFTAPRDEPFTKDSRKFQSHLLRELIFVSSFFYFPQDASVIESKRELNVCTARLITRSGDGYFFYLKTRSVIRLKIRMF